MRKRRTISTYFFRFLRKLGLLCKKKTPIKPPTIKIAKSINPDGSTSNHDDFMFAKNILTKSFSDSKIRTVCQYDFIKKNCRCGIDISKLRNGEKCKLNK